MGIGKRIEQLIEDQKLNNTDFSKKINVNRTTVVNTITNDTVPRGDLIISIITAYPKLNTRWLLLGEGEMWPKEKNKVQQPKAISEDYVKDLRFMIDNKTQLIDALRDQLETTIERAKAAERIQHRLLDLIESMKKEYKNMGELENEVQMLRSNLKKAN